MQLRQNSKWKQQRPCCYHFLPHCKWIEESFFTQIPYDIFALLSKGNVELTKYFQRPFKASDLKCFVKMSKSGFVHSNILCSFSIAANIGFVWSYIIMIWHDLKWMWICNLVLRQYTNAVQTNKHTNKQNANAVSQCLKPFFIFRWVSTALLYTLGTVRV